MISDAFNKKATIDEAISYLENYVPHANWSGWEIHADRWKKDATDAAFWLKEYKANFYNKELE